jgi:regulator of protease activity HflC (stomatin/prohibitin superfamily)
MLGFQRAVIADHERGLLLRDRRLHKVLGPGSHVRLDPMHRDSVQVFDLGNPVLDHPQAEIWARTHPEVCEGQLRMVELGDEQVGLVYYDGRFVEILPPSTRRVYWLGPVEVRVDRVDIRDSYELPRKLASVLVHPRGDIVPRTVATHVLASQVAEQSVGLLIVDGELVQVLEPGLHAFWRFNRSIRVEHLDTRVQAMDVSGQEILSRDKVSLRLNLTALYRVVDAVRARKDLRDPMDWLYRELQLALRQAVGSRTLDALLGNKDELDRSVFEQMSAKAREHGLEVTSVGVKDVILPGDMKEILNQVVAAEKAAQANIIKRREETAATRSLLNTAKLMDENPTLRRLKELEVLEKVTEKVDRLTVFGGMDGVLKDTVRINV